MTPQQRKWLRYLVDFSAPTVFALVYFLGGRDFMKASLATVAASLIAVLIGLIVERRIAALPLFVGVMGGVFAALTLIFHEAWIFKVRPTVMNGIIGAILLIGLAIGKSPIKAVLGETLTLPDEVWRILAKRFGLFYLAIAGLNLIVWQTQSEATWVAFDTIGLRIVTFAFGLTQTPLLMKYLTVDEVPPPPPSE
ncbi:septation protein IspZ [Phenylobacterium sp.]|uniref:inner membrane-spanning protein YciB n=1 Tax=Phenylobacterium sp. TaxID=1871053 RepID=UPI0025E713D1|nr:septation protein IspZ [Phenylobacterium sp.]